MCRERGRRRGVDMDRDVEWPAMAMGEACASWFASESGRLKAAGLGSSPHVWRTQGASA